MKTFITYLLVSLCTLCSLKAKAEGHILNYSPYTHSKENFSKKINPNNEKIIKTYKDITLDDLLTTTDPVEDESSQTDPDTFNNNAFFRLLSVIYILNLFVKGLRKNHYFYTKSIHISRCKYILHRVFRI